LTIPEVTHLLKVAQQKLEVPMKAGKKKPSTVTVNPGDLIPYLAVGLWGGVRPEESVRMRWEHVDFRLSQLDLSEEITKDHERRTFRVEPVLIEWLKLYRPTNGQGKIVVNHEWKFRAFVKAANFSPWPKDCLRKSYGSYHLAEFRDAGDTADNMGHENPRTFYRHYRDVIKDPADAKAYWELTPENVLTGQTTNLPPTRTETSSTPSVTETQAGEPVEVHLRKAAPGSKGRREFSDDEVEQIKAERAQGATYTELAEKWRCSKSTLSYMLSETAQRQGVYDRRKSEGDAKGEDK
jgi:hypothetical protein